MEDLLLLKYPKLRDRILNARESGLSDDDIEGKIAWTIERKQARGMNLADINNLMGVNPATKAKYGEAKRFNAMESISDAYKLSYDRAGQIYDKSEEKKLPISAVQEFPDLFQDRLHERETTDRNPAIAQWNAMGEDRLNRMVGGITMGFMGAAEGMFDGVDWLTGYEGARKWADKLAGASQSLNDELMQGREGDLWDGISQGLGSSGVFILPGVAVASFIGKAAKLGTFARTIANLTGLGVNMTTESLAEAGGVYRQVRERTGDEMSASAAASATFWMNMPLNFITDKVGFFSDIPAFNKFLASGLPEKFVPVASNALKGFVSEGLQETTQGAISTVYGEDKSWGDLNLSEIAGREGLPGAIVGALFGIGVGQDVRESVVRANESKAVRESAQKVVNKAKEVLAKTGRPVEEIDSASALLGAYSMVASKRLGISPEEWFHGKGLEVAETEATEGLVLNQADVETPEFKAWFGDSKVVDENGEPLVVFHGASHSIAEFDPQKIHMGVGFFFTRSKSYAKKYADRYVGKNNGTVIPVFLRVTNPIFMDSEEGKRIHAEIMGTARDKDGVVNRDDYVREATARGYDGRVLAGDIKTGEIEVFSPTQIKSVNNEGTFDPDNPNIYKQGAREGLVLNQEDAKDLAPKVDAPAGRFANTKEDGYDTWYNTAEEAAEAMGAMQNNGLKPDFVGKAYDSKIGDFRYKVYRSTEEIERLNAEYRSKVTAQEEAEAKKAAELKAQKEDVDGFDSGLSPMQRGKVLKNLDKQIRVNGKVKTIKELVRELVANGEKPDTAEENVIKDMPRRKFNNATLAEQQAHERRVREAGTKTVYYVGGYDLGKTAHDYAEYLISKPGIAPSVPKADTQSAQPRGQIALSSGKAILKTFANADASTIVHEMGHLFLADTQQAFAEGKLTGRDAQDFRTLSKWLEAEEGKELTREQHEKFAQGFEQYLREGKAPSVKLKRVFERFRQWLTDIYRNAEDLGAPLPDDIRDVFDRMLAFDSDIDLARKLDAVQDEDAPEQTDYPTPEEEAEDEADDLMDAALDGNIEAMASIMGNEDVKPTPKERAERLKRRAGEWVERQVARVAEGSRIGDYIEEWHALKELMASEKERGKGLKKGGGRLESRARVRAIRSRLAENTMRKDVKQVVRAITDSTKGAISAKVRDEIRTLLNGYNLKKSDIRGLDSLRAEFEAYIAESAQAKKDVDGRVEDEAEALNARAVGEMTMDELVELAKTVKELAKLGREEYKAWKLKGEERKGKLQSVLESTLEAPMVEIVNASGEKVLVHERTDAEPFTQESKRNKKENVLKRNLAKTLRPARLMRFLDNHQKNGVWFRKLIIPARQCRDAFLKMKDARMEWLDKTIEKHGLTMAGLGEIRLRTKNSYGQDVNLNLEECMHVYAAYGNWLNRQAFIYGNGWTQNVLEEAIGELTEEERAFADELLQEEESHFDRINAVLEDTFQIRMDKVKNHVTMFRVKTSEIGKAGDDAINDYVSNIARLSSMRKTIVKKGFAQARKEMMEEFQAPIQTGLVSVWTRTMTMTEYTSAFAKDSTDIQDVLNRGYRQSPSLLALIEKKHGKTFSEAVKNWANTITMPEFYRAFTAMDEGLRKVRANSGIARMAFNFLSAGKQLVAFVFYLADAGPVHMASSIAQFAADPKGLCEFVWEHDPHVKEQAIDRTLEELKASNDPKYMRVRKQVAKAGFGPMVWFDMAVRVAGWKATYDKAKSKGMSDDEATIIAQDVTLATQNAADPEELPLYMKGGELMNLVTQFTNQANQIFNLTFYDVPADFLSKNKGHGVGTMTGLVLSAILMGILKNGRPPEDPQEAAGWVAEEELGSIPLFGNAMTAAMAGFGGSGTAIDSIGSGIVRAAKETYDGDYEKAAYAAGEVVALTRGLPYQGSKRIWKAVYNGDWKELFGWASGNRGRRSTPTW